MIGSELLARLTYGHVVAAVLSMCLVLLLFTGSFTAISIRFSTAFAYSTSTTNSSIMNKEIPAQVKSFILNQIVNKSKAAVVVGFVDPNDTRLFSFENMSKAHNIPVNEDTLFDIGSITKTFTILLLVDMLEQG
jgi:CubicO group peptidase (beta-lactamase class C family)